MRQACWLLLLSLFFAPAFLCAQQQPEKPEKKEALPHPKTLAEFQSAAKNTIEKEHVPGVGIALISNGQVLWCGGIGKADIAQNHDITCDTEFRVGSISKTFVSLALLKLEEDGHINLQSRLQDVAPEVPFKNPWESTNPVRITNLLEHTAGFDDMAFREVYNTSGPPNISMLEVLKKFPKPQDVRWPPGTRFSYSNPDYGIAGYLVEKSSGQPWTSYIRTNILAPLEISSGDFDFAPQNRALLAQGYQRPDGKPVQPVAYKEIYLRPAGDMKASPAELAKLVQFFLRRGATNEKQLLKPETIARMEYPQTPLSSRNGLRLGYGLANYTEVKGGVVTHGHDGGIDGFISTYRYMPEQNWGYVVLLNADFSGKALDDLNSLAIDFLSKDFPKTQPPLPAASKTEFRQFEGLYASRAPRNQFFAFLSDLLDNKRVQVKNGQLVLAGMFDQPQPIFPVGKNLFRGEKDPEATIAFFSNAAGQMCLVAQGDDGTSYSERVNPVWPYLRLCLLVLSAFLLATSLLYAIVWILLWLLRRLKDIKHLNVRAIPFFAALTLLVSFFSGSKSLDTLGAFGFWSVFFFLGTITFAALSLIGLYLAVTVPRDEIHPAIRIHSLLVSLACCILTIFLASWHLLAVRLWAS
ncbi:MAG TPA: serine hydrolase [Candidatus Dormibacteraeota bacterium]|jgi:CubicO group peptidase (beta-lactamase class C family)|nr:serine hydrolase [Candidatus Dormibacteraeota bacterium]